MSVQLIVYPQSNSEGVYEPTSTPLFPEHVSNYTFNNSAFGSSYNLTGTPALDTVIANVTPTNTWALAERYVLTGFSLEQDRELPETWKKRIDE